MKYLFLGVLLILSATLPSVGTSGDALDWSLANGFGYAACLLLVLVCAFGAHGVPKGPGYHWHRDIGFAAVLLTALHVLVLLFDPAVWAYLKVGAPAYMWAGLIACLPLLALSVGAVRWSRRRWPADPAVFRNVHTAWTWALLLLLAWHVVGAGAYARGLFGQALITLAILGLPLVAYASGKPIGARTSDLPNRRWTLGSATCLLLLFVLLHGPAST